MEEPQASRSLKSTVAGPGLTEAATALRFKEDKSSITGHECRITKADLLINSTLGFLRKIAVFAARK